jgi:hypothetical protein
VTWLERYIFPLERGFDEETAERLAPQVFGRWLARERRQASCTERSTKPSLDARSGRRTAHAIRA